MIGKLVGSNRVSAEVEIAGLDVPEMGVPGYPEFVPPIAVVRAVPAAEVAAAKAGDLASWRVVALVQRDADDALTLRRAHARLGGRSRSCSTCC